MSHSSYVGLIDCNNFFVSCERLFRPDLHKRPVVVLSGNDGVVVARSEEVKKLGVPMGAPVFKVKDIFEAHNVTVFSGNHELYRDISKRVMNTLKQELHTVRQYSVDEAFFKLNARSPRSARSELSRLKLLVERNIGVPVSLGAGLSMTIAKHASEREKRASGVCVLQGETWRKVAKEVPLSEVWGIGLETAKKMRHHKLVTVQDLLTADIARIEKIFGVHGLRLRAELSESGAYDLEKRKGLKKSLMSSRSFTKPVSSLSLLEEAFSHHVNKVAEELREDGGFAKTIRVVLGTSRHGDWFLRGASEGISLIKATNDTRVILKTVISMVRKLYDKDVPYKKAGVILSDISDGQISQLDLFGLEEKEDESENLMRIMDSINSKYKETLVAVGQRANIEDRLTRKRHRSPRYTTRWNELATVTC